ARPGPRPRPGPVPPAARPAPGPPPATAPIAGARTVCRSTTVSIGCQSQWLSFLAEQSLSLSGQPGSTVYLTLPQPAGGGAPVAGGQQPLDDAPAVVVGEHVGLGVRRPEQVEVGTEQR